MKKINYNPDVLDALANLSNDEVFTPPKLVNEILDLLPVEIWQDKNAKFLDPACKTGVFLREIAARLVKGLEREIPNKQKRINHIFNNQIFGIAITELTALLSRRSIYCSKKSNGKYSVCTDFKNEIGNIIFNRIKHTWDINKCKYCGANLAIYKRSGNLETHAYEFIHVNNVNKIFNNMKFDVIIGNPPYQLSDGSGKGAGAMPIYNKFVQQAKKLNPRFLTMIIPSRWFTGGRGLDSFREEMLNDDRLMELHDFLDAGDCFPGVEIKGGVCYFVWSRDYRGLTKIVTHEKREIISIQKRKLLFRNSNVFIRYNQAISILEKVSSRKEKSFSNIVSSAKPFGLRTYYKADSKKQNNSIKVYANKHVGFINKNEILQNKKWVGMHKVIVPYAIGSGDSKTDLIKPLYAGPNTCCTETYLVIGPFASKKSVESVISYIKTKFFHFLITMKKNTQHATKSAYYFVPMQDFTKSWTDEKLYKKYKLSKDEIKFIESMIRPMDLGK